VSTPDGKASFDHIYDQPDPREYFRTLHRVEYRIPADAQGVFRRLLAVLDRRRAPDAPPVTVLDVCCSYGVNAALLGYDLTLDDLYAHYAGADVAAAPRAELLAADRTWYAERRRPHPRVRLLGLDAAGSAVAYGREAGLLDDGWAENLELSEPSDRLATHAGAVDLVTITGGVGYVTGRTFARLLDVLAPARLPWVAAFALRSYSYDDIAAALDRYGLVTEQAGTTFRQRRFADDDEQQAALAAVRGRGLDKAGRESDGWLHCDLFLSRPGDEVDPPLAGVLAAG